MSSELKLKIGLVLDSSLDLEDGVQQYVMTVGEWLRSQGHDVHYLVGETNNRQLPNIHSLSKNFVAKFNGNRIDLPLAANKKRINELMKREQFDILHVQTPHHPFMAQRIIKRAGRKTAVVATFHILPYNRFAGVSNKLLGWWLRSSLKRVDKMLAVTKAAADFEQKTFGLPAEVLPNVFDYNLFHSAKPFDRYKDETITVLFLGRLVPRKGCQTLLLAIAVLSKRTDLPPFRVVVCGRGPLESELRSYAEKAEITELVEFTGFVSDEDKPSYYSSADISVFPSNGGESFGIVLLEAMASGKSAVLAGDNPGYRTVMEPKPSLLFPPTDANELAERLENLIMSEADRRQFADWGSGYTKEFDINVVGTKLLEIYEDLYHKRNMQ